MLIQIIFNNIKLENTEGVTVNKHKENTINEAYTNSYDLFDNCTNANNDLVYAFERKIIQDHLDIDEFTKHKDEILKDLEDVANKIEQSNQKSLEEWADFDYESSNLEEL